MFYFQLYFQLYKGPYWVMHACRGLRAGSRPGPAIANAGDGRLSPNGGLKGCIAPCSGANGTSLARSHWPRLHRAVAKRLQCEIAQAEPLDVVVLLFVLVEVAFLVVYQSFKDLLGG